MSGLNYRQLKYLYEIYRVEAFNAVLRVVFGSFDFFFLMQSVPCVEHMYC